jgi:pSer/pThr/pTyr-binding forkhead associated (FHA) protein
MKVSLVVLSEGKLLGRTIPITLSQFIIGRDPECQLRPASALISKRHCAVIVRGGKVFVRDFDSTNGTFVNDSQVKGECEVKNDNTLKVGPLTFRVVVQGTTVQVTKPAPLPTPAAKAAVSKAPANEGSGDDDSIAAMLLDSEGDKPSSTEQSPSGTTTVEMVAPSDSDTAENLAVAGGEPKEKLAKEKEPEKKKSMGGDTSAAAQAILQKYMRRQRS